MSGTIQASVVKDSASATNNLTLDTGGNATVGNTLVMGSSFLRNRIINGDMRINQRGYVSGTPLTATNNFCTDRFNVTCATTGGFSAYQSTTAPTGFTNSLFFTKTTGASPAVAEANFIYQAVEGYNMSDLAWGTANAKTVTLSFWVYAGATGTFSGSLRNGAATFYSYPFTYTIAAANTWTQITTTIAGPTVGTWTSDNTAGIYLFFDLGCGTNFRGTAGAWSAGNYIGATGATTYPVSTTGGTFYVTGVQLEVGTVATPFERRQYGEELMLCQRYYYRISASGNYTSFGLGITYATTTALLNMPLPVTMRTAPTAADFSAAGNFVIYDGGTNSTVTAIVLSYVSTNSISMTGTTGATMTAARPALLEANVALAAYIGVTAEL